MKKADAFATDLQGLYNSNFQLTSNTRTADGAPIVNEEGCNFLDQRISDIISDYNILEETKSSGYYSNLMNSDINSMEEFDFYDFLNLISEEGTPAMQHLVNQIIYDDNFNIESVINNDAVLSFEKLILVVSYIITKNCDNSLIVETRSDATDKCLAQYNSAVNSCYWKALGNVGLSIVTGIFTGGATALGGSILAAGAYVLCKDAASRKLEDCLRTATEQ